MSTIEMSYMEVGDDIVEIVDAKSRNDIKQLNVNKDDLYRVKADSIKRTFEGETILLNDCSNNGFEGLRVFGRSEQASTTGKNLLENKISSQTKNGVTITKNDDGSITLNGTASAWFFVNLNHIDTNTKSIPAGDYIVSGGYSSLVRVEVLASSASVGFSSGSEKAFSIKESDRNSWARITVDAGVNLSNVILYPMIRLASITDGTYEPYTGGKPSPNPEYPQPIESVGKDGNIDVGVYGKNLFGGEAFANKFMEIVENASKDAEKGTVYAVAGYVKGKIFFDTFKENTQYTLILKASVRTPGGTSIFIKYTDGTELRPSIQETGVVTTVRVVSEAGKTISRIEGIWQADTTYYYNECGLFEGAVELEDFEPCTKQSLAIPTPNGLPGIKVTDASLATYTDAEGKMWCADEIDFARGKYIQRIYSFIFDGSSDENWIVNTSNPVGTRFYINTNSIRSVMAFQSPLLCSHYLDKPETDNAVSTYYGAGTVIWVVDSSFASVGEFKAFLSNNPMTVKYVLETPIETDLTQAELEAFKVLHSNYLNTTILNDSNARMEVTYSADTATYLDNTYGKEIKRIDDTNTIKRTYSGDAIVATDSAEAKLEGLRVFGRSEQPSTTGAQLLNIDAIDDKSSNGIDWVFKDGYIKINGTATGHSVTNIYPSFTPGTYSINGVRQTSDNGFVYRVYVLQADGTEKRYYDTPFVINGTESDVYLQFQVYKDTTVNNLVFYPMLNEGTTALPWEPYTGGKPSPNPEYPQPIESVGDDGSVDVGVYGKNLFDIEKWLNDNNVIWSKSGDVYTIRTEQTLYNNLYVFSEIDTDVTFSGKLLNSTSDNARIEFFDSSGKIVKSFFESYDYAQCKACSLRLNWSTYGELTISKPQLELGTEATPYEPYTKQSLSITTPNGLPGIKVTDASLATYTDSDGKMRCADEIDFARGKYIQRIGIETLSKTPTFVETGDYKGRYIWYSCLKNRYKNGNFRAMSSFAYWFAWGQNSRNEDYFALDGNHLYYKPAESMTANDVNSLFAEMIASNNPPEILGILETPIETDLTAEEIEAYRALHSNYPTTTILNDDNAYMEATMVADTKNHIEQNYVPLDSYKSLEARVLAVELALA